MTDSFTNIPDKTNPANRHFQIVPHASTPMVFQPRAIYCAVDGTAQVVDEVGTVLPYAMTAGQYIPFRGVRLDASTTGTFYGWY